MSAPWANICLMKLNRVNSGVELDKSCGYNVATSRKGVPIMLADSVVRARVNGKLKEDAADILAAAGLTLSDAYRMMLIRVVQDKALPFDPLIPNKKTIAAMKAARAGRVTKSKNLDDLFGKLNAND